MTESDVQAALRHVLPGPDEALEAALRAQATVLAMAINDRESIRSTRRISVSPLRQQRGFRRGHTPPGARGLRAAANARAVGVVSASLANFGTIEKLPVVTQVGGTALPGFAAEFRWRRVVDNVSPSVIDVGAIMAPWLQRSARNRPRGVPEPEKRSVEVTIR